ncbi:tetratricopeptide repeat protein 34 [Carcharodon carcharias]|uniref:tetratricopeptide repeat protein 34 n=1 Tax=Carcharodon carcharias TaxID=13397 RepID=UPI001B7EB160|nr:tetratricopeptide repeat protein 34 [Carcharodon carcharias]
MSEQELPTQLCTKGDQYLASGSPAEAAACYTIAFSQSAETTVQHVKSLGELGLGDVLAVLEGWCADQSWVPRQAGGEPAGKAPVSVGVAAVFLSTLSPSNLTASVLRMDALLRSGRHQEAVSRCNALLNAHPRHSLELLLTRALAWVLSDSHSANGVVDYLQAFVKRQEETVAFVIARQKRDLPRILRAFDDYISLHEGRQQIGRPAGLLSDCRHFLSLVSSRDVSAHRACAAHPLEKRRLEESAGSGSAALARPPGLGRSKPEAKALLLIGRAAAHFAVGNRDREVIHDLASAFESSPAFARKHFEQLFVPHSVVERAKQFIEAQFSEYKATVRCRADLRSDGGAELLRPVLEALQLVAHIEPENKRDLEIRQADCKLLCGEAESSLRLCQGLLAADPTTYHSTILVLRGFSHLRAGDLARALEDFQSILEHDLPHPGSCVKAMCGRGLVRMLSGSPYLTALDYITASRLRLDEVALFVKSYVPWNQRGLLYKVLQEEGQKILRKKHSSPSASAGLRKKSAERGNYGFSFKEGDALGVHYLALLLLELEPSDEISRILSADALYQLGWMEEAYKTLLVSLGKNPQQSSVLARLALLQLKKGFLYDANQLIKKVIEIGDTSCLLPIMDVFKSEDRDLMQRHCHSSAMSILQNKEGDTYVKEAVAYLSLAIISSGGTDEASLLTRARCYAHLNQKKTAIFDFGTILKANPSHVQARCGRSFMYVILNKQKEAVQDIALALQTDQKLAIQEISSLKHEAQNLISRWLHDHCINILTGMAESKEKVFSEELVNLPAIGRYLLLINERDSTWHILYADILIAKEMYDDALKHLQEIFGQVPNDDAVMARYGLIQMKRKNVQLAVRNLSILAEKDNKDLDFLLQFLDYKSCHHVAQVASEEAGTLIKGNQLEKALKYCTLAVLASKNKAKYIRPRAICLTRLKQYERALKDLREIIKRNTSSNSPELVEDYCSAGHIQFLILKDEEACNNYIKALQLDQSVALTNISSRPGRVSLSQHFQRIALHYFEQQLYEEAWHLAEYGLIIDESNTELKKLRARIKREASGCVVH